MTIRLEDAALTISFLSEAYAGGTWTPVDIVREVWRRFERDASTIRHVWIHRRTLDEIEAAAREVERRQEAGETLPLYGLPFAVKDNIDVGGISTTAACTAFSRLPTVDAAAVARLIRAGAIFIGKTNLDQLATGLVGVRSPYGVPTNPFDAKMIPGGSSSGSAVAVAQGYVTFALGTDTAGSGRVPAGFNNIVGLKPTRGLLSTTGVVPACRSLDCISIFAFSVPDARTVAEVAKGYDEADPFSRADADTVSFLGGTKPKTLRLAVPAPSDLEFYGDEEAARCFQRAVDHWVTLGAELVTVDLKPFREAAKLLYEGPWVAERLVAGERVLAEHPSALIPVLRDILAGASKVTGVDTFRGLYRLEELRHIVAHTWEVADALLVPTSPSIYAVSDVLAEPLKLNTQLGHYTNFVNLLDLSALAVPAGFRADGLPTGVTLIGKPAGDAGLANWGEIFHRSLGLTLGATGQSYESFASERRPASERALAPVTVPIAVVGAHMSGLPLNYQMLEAGATLLAACRTAPSYRLFALPNTSPPKPGMIKVARGRGAAIELEVWAMPLAAFGRFVAGVPSPLCIGTVQLEDGTAVHGFLCETDAVTGGDGSVGTGSGIAIDISHHGGWRSYLRANE